MWQSECSLAWGSSTMVWRSYYMPTFIGLTCLSASSTNCVWWCADARTALLHNIWWYIGHQSLRPHHDSIFVRLPAINWQCRHIGGPHNMAVERLLSLVCRCGTHCQNVYVIPLLVLLFLPVFLKQSSSQCTSVPSALEALVMMWYINLRFTSHYITSAAPPAEQVPPSDCQQNKMLLTGVCKKKFPDQNWATSDMPHCNKCVDLGFYTFCSWSTCSHTRNI